MKSDSINSKVNIFLRDGVAPLGLILESQMMEDVRSLIVGEGFEDGRHYLVNESPDILIRLFRQISNHEEVKCFLNELTDYSGSKVFILPPFEIIKNMLPDVGQWTWHCDADEEFADPNCDRYLDDAKYVYGKIGIYLQGNGEWGGSIDYLSRSHKHVRRTHSFIGKLRPFRFRLLQFVYTRIGAWFPSALNRLSEIILPGFKCHFSVPGHAVVFDSRLIHRPSPLKIKGLSGCDGLYNRPSRGIQKIAIYLQFGNHLGLTSYWRSRKKFSHRLEEMELWKRVLACDSEVYPDCLRDDINQIFLEVISES